MGGAVTSIAYYYAYMKICNFMIPVSIVLFVITVTASASVLAQVGERVAFDGFALDRTEVTIGQFATYADAKKIVTAAEREGGGFEWGAGWERRPGWTFRKPFGAAPDSPDHPAVHVSWFEARDYCAWAGGRLPTAAEWIGAAYTERRADPPAPFAKGKTYRYPTGDAPAGANTSAPDAWPRSAPAGRTEAGVNGLYDMGGNAWEWVADAQGEERRTMGGSWWYGPEQTTPDVVAFKPAAFHAVYVGFRCAYDAPRGK